MGEHQEDALEKTMDKLKKDKESNGGVAYTADELLELKKIETEKLKEEIVAMSLIKRADKKRFGNLQIQLKNSFLLGSNEYPTTVTDVLKILNNYKPEWKNGVNPNANSRNNDHNNNNSNNNSNNGVSLLQTQNNGCNIAFLRGTNNSFSPTLHASFVDLKDIINLIVRSRSTIKDIKYQTTTLPALSLHQKERCVTRVCHSISINTQPLTPL